MTGTVVTFYSYKGGVGRSFTLANIALLLARWGYRVLAIDWDLEAPGLHHYFAPAAGRATSRRRGRPRGDFVAGRADPRDHTVPLALGEDDGEGSVDLLAAGRQDEAYSAPRPGHRLAGALRPGLRRLPGAGAGTEWTATYDFVLIDSRTGISDIGGHLHRAPARPAGGRVHRQRAERRRRGRTSRAGRTPRATACPTTGQPHLVLPMLSRLDNRVEYKQAELWQRRCAATVAPLFRNWLVKSVSADLMLRHLTLPYISYWSFGEQLAVREERTPSADQISFALETVAAVHRAAVRPHRPAGREPGRLRRRGPDPAPPGLRPGPAGVGSATGAGRGRASSSTSCSRSACGAGRSVSGDPEFLDAGQRSGAAPVPGRRRDEVSRWQATEAGAVPAARPGRRATTGGCSACSPAAPIPRRCPRSCATCGTSSWTRRAAAAGGAAAARPDHRRPRAPRRLRPGRAAQRRGRAAPGAATNSRTAAGGRCRADRPGHGRRAGRRRPGTVLKDLTVDLEVLSEVRADGARFPEPDGLHERGSARSRIASTDG